MLARARAGIPKNIAIDISKDDILSGLFSIGFYNFNEKNLFT